MAFAYSNQIYTGGNWDNAWAYRQAVRAINPPQDQVRVRFVVGTTAGSEFLCTKAAIGLGTGTKADTTATPTELLFGGVSGFDIPLGAPPGAARNFQWSDWLTFGGWSVGDPLVVVIELGSPALGELMQNNGGLDGANSYLYSGGAATAGITISVPGVAEDFNIITGSHGIDLIETRKFPFADPMTFTSAKRLVRTRQRNS